MSSESLNGNLQDVRASLNVRRRFPDIDDEQLEEYLADNDAGRYLRECRYRGANADEIEEIRRRLSGKLDQVTAFDKYQTTDFVPQPHQLTEQEQALADKLAAEGIAFDKAERRKLYQLIDRAIEEKDLRDGALFVPHSSQ